MVLLAVLVHVLACAHGPAPAGSVRADAIVAVSSASCGQSAASDGDSSTVRDLDPTQGGGSHCRNLDQPTTQPPRDITFTTAAHLLLPAERADSLPGPAGDQPSRYATSPPISVQQERARLGVWRT
ncbi:hypothetical protein Strvi_2261 [Streptomyces violaceusniger Tu 4113]|uniref:Secreted protein n=1 Tax=Streptomyces violaceusniger (strain Tu 4113) TaxID=653045 RepID=G2PCG0_STRV4|nr:hypothetical protein Strvi_2261 [Streptomyces violaceusniger Tu 4113]